jgi:hypothetical protein
MLPQNTKLKIQLFQMTSSPVHLYVLTLSALLRSICVKPTVGGGSGLFGSSKGTRGRPGVDLHPGGFLCSALGFCAAERAVLRASPAMIGRSRTIAQADRPKSMVLPAPVGGSIDVRLFRASMQRCRSNFVFRSLLAGSPNSAPLWKDGRSATSCCETTESNWDSLGSCSLSSGFSTMLQTRRLAATRRVSSNLMTFVCSSSRALSAFSSFPLIVCRNCSRGRRQERQILYDCDTCPNLQPQGRQRVRDATLGSWTAGSAAQNGQGGRDQTLVLLLDTVLAQLPSLVLMVTAASARALFLSVRFSFLHRSPCRHLPAPA